MEKIMFVAFSHTLTEEQIQDAKTSLGVTRIVTLKEVNPELQALFSQVPANATLEEIQDLALQIVAEAKKVQATVFFCTGEPTLMMWANLLASGNFMAREGLFSVSEPTVLSCVQSTTERQTVEKTNPDGSVTKTQVFRHVCWRPMF